MNLLKRFIRGTDPIDDPIDEIEGDEFDNSYDEQDLSNPEIAKGLAAVNSSDRKKLNFKTIANAEKVALKIMVPHSTADAAAVADLLKEGSIILLDISNLEKEQAYRLVDFLAGVAYVIGGEMTKTNRNTIIISPSGVDIAGVIPDFGGDAED